MYGARHFCAKKTEPDGVPQKGSAGMIITDIVDDNVQDYVWDFCVYVRRFCLRKACPMHLTLSLAKLNPAQFMSRTMMYHGTYTIMVDFLS